MKVTLLLLTGLLVIAIVVAQSIHADRKRLARERAALLAITRYQPRPPVDLWASLIRWVLVEDDRRFARLFLVIMLAATVFIFSLRAYLFSTLPR